MEINDLQNSNHNLYCLAITTTKVLRHRNFCSAMYAKPHKNESTALFAAL